MKTVATGKRDFDLPKANQWSKWDSNSEQLAQNLLLFYFCGFIRWPTAYTVSLWGFPGGSDSEESACNVGDLGSIPGLGGSPGRGHGNPLQYSCLEIPMDRGAWQATVHGVAKSQT